MEKTLLDYWFTLYKRRYVIGLIMLSSLATTLAISLLLPPVYEAKAVFFVPQRPSSSTFLGSPEGSAIAKTTLIPDPSENSNAPYLGILKSKALAELVKTEYPDKSVDDLKRRDTNYVLTNEYLIEVYARDEHAADAAGIANAYVRHFNRIMQGISDNYRLNSIRQGLVLQIAAAENELAVLAGSETDVVSCYRLVAGDSRRTDDRAAERLERAGVDDLAGDRGALRRPLRKKKPEVECSDDQDKRACLHAPSLRRP